MMNKEKIRSLVEQMINQVDALQKEVAAIKVELSK